MRAEENVWNSRPRLFVPSRGRLGHMLAVGIISAFVIALSAPQFALGQVTKGASVFDEEKRPTDPKPATADKKPAVSDRDTIGFTQENVSAQMTELEERMFRLAEALRGLEPENASRLRLALKFSREELILQQMKDTQKLLKDAQLSKAETEVRELLAKLEHLRNLLLAEDLDFQMKLARLRQMRETISQLDRIIKEEKRELAWSNSAIAQGKDLDKLRAHRTDLETLVRDQKAIVAETREAPTKDARAPLRDREATIQKTAAALAVAPLFANLEPAYLKQADTHLGDALTALPTSDGAAAVASEEQALALFEKEQARLNERTAATAQALAAPEFQKFERDQSRNRTATDTLGAVSARLGDTGVALQKDLIRASESMQAAEGDLAKTAAKPAADDQSAALKHLVKSQADLAKAIEGLLVELRSELHSRIVAELTEMHEAQAAIRETTEAQAPRIAQKSRAALVLVVSLSGKEADLGERTEHLLALVEETEYGIALPTSLRVLSREMRTIQGWLKEGDASPRTVSLEKRVEDDLLGLLEAMRRLPPTTPPPPGSPLPSDLRAQERELNRLIAELKMVRLLQSRLNDDTIGVDKTRPGAPPLPAALKQEIEALKGSQDEIRDALAKIGKGVDLAPEPAPTTFPDPFKIDR